MKNYFNQSGNLSLVLLIAFVFSMTVIALSSLFLAEKINYRYSVVADAERMYRNDAIVEVTINGLKQVLDSKAWNASEQELRGSIFEAVDLSEVDVIVNQEFISNYSNNRKAIIEEIENPGLIENYCYAEIGTEGMTYICSDNNFNVKINLTVNRDGKMEMYTIDFQNMYFKVSENNNLIIDFSKYKVKISK